MPPLLKLGALVAAMPQARVRIAGYADPRGSQAYNSELSLRRAQGVAAVLMAAGVAPSASASRRTATPNPPAQTVTSTATRSSGA